MSTVKGRVNGDGRTPWRIGGFALGVAVTLAVARTDVVESLLAPGASIEPDEQLVEEVFPPAAIGAARAPDAGTAAVTDRLPPRAGEVVDGADTVRWSSVWQTFASERTARGFADYIGEMTGLALRVGEPDDSGRYVVEVSHRSGAERAAAIERIVRATGYRPPGER